MIKVGSRVKFISDTGVGYIRSIEGNLAQVEVEDGFEIPALINDLIEVPIEAENEAIVRIGPDDEKPAAPKPAEGAPGKKQDRIVVPGGKNRYGRISLVDDYEDEPVYLKKPQRQTDDSPEAAPAEPEKAPWEETDYRVKLFFVPVSGEKPAEDSDLDLYLVNDSSYTLFFSIAQYDSRKGYVRTIESGTLEADSKINLKSYKRTELANVSTLHINLLPFKPTAFVPRATEGFDLELHPLKFVRPGNYIENDYFDLPAVEFTLADQTEL